MNINREFRNKQVSNTEINLHARFKTTSNLYHGCYNVLNSGRFRRQWQPLRCIKNSNIKEYLVLFNLFVDRSRGTRQWIEESPFFYYINLVILPCLSNPPLDRNLLKDAFYLCDACLHRLLHVARNGKILFTP